MVKMQVRPPTFGRPVESGGVSLPPEAAFRRPADSVHSALPPGFGNGRTDNRPHRYAFDDRVLDRQEALGPAASDEAVEALLKIEDVVDNADLTDDQRRRLLHRVGRLHEQKKELGKYIANKETVIRALKDLQDWVESGPITMQRPEGSFGHKLAEAFHAGSLIWPLYPHLNDGHQAHPNAFLDFEQVFVVEHDWAAAFAGAEDYAGGDTPELPYNVCLFEFKISGRRVVLLYNDNQKASAEYWFSAVDLGWTWTAISVWQGPLDKAAPLDNGDPEHARIFGAWRPWMELMLAQVRAITIALDAEVVETPLIRAPEKLNRARAKRGALPLFDYHVVRLGRRVRADRLPSTGEPGRRVRLHFRRGHWRHYADHRTWIKWMLVGNPDLGFIDKHYKL